MKNKKSYSMFTHECIQIAKNEASKSDHMYFRHGAVSVYRNKILTKGYNRPLFKDLIYTSLHAEMSVIQQLKRMRCSHKKKKKIDIFVIRINKNEELRLSKPCNQCQNIMKQFGVKRCFYSNDLGKIDVMVF